MYDRFEVTDEDGATVFSSLARRPWWRWIGVGLVAASMALRAWLPAETAFAFFLVLAGWSGFALLVAEALVATERPRGRFVHADRLRFEDATDAGYRDAARPASVVMGEERWAQDELSCIDLGRHVVQRRERIGDAVARHAATRHTVQLVFPDRVVQVADLLEAREAEDLVDELQAALQVKVEVRHGEDEDVLRSHHASLGFLAVVASTAMGAVLMVPPAGRTGLAALVVGGLPLLVWGAVLALRGGEGPWNDYAERRFPALPRRRAVRIAPPPPTPDASAEEASLHEAEPLANRRRPS